MGGMLSMCVKSRLFNYKVAFSLHMKGHAHSKKAFYKFMNLFTLMG
jgi:hypothetical protein